jgi:thymidylate synthase (FAD)
MKATLIDHMGSDLNIVNAARVSFGKKKECEEYTVVYYVNDSDNSTAPKTAKVPKLENADKKLINYLADHDHWSPMAHASLQFHIKSPLFVARQLGKHQVGLVWNEISRRYVDSEPEFYVPDSWRARAENVKQGSSETIVVDVEDTLLTTCNNACLSAYKELLQKGVAPEQARMVLPQNTMTEWYWSGTLYAFARVCRLRMAADAQYETRIIANMIHDSCELLFPVAWNALMKNNE